MNPLRNPNINYYRGWFFVTFQVAQNKSVFGVIADGLLTLNALGLAVRENLQNLGRVFRELYIDTAMVMPNHVHVVLKIESVQEGYDLAYFIGRFKLFTTHLYLAQRWAAIAAARGLAALPAIRDFQVCKGRFAIVLRRTGTPSR